MRSFFKFLLAVLTIITLNSCGSEQRYVPTGSADSDVNRCLQLSSRKKYEKAVECLEIYKSRYPTDDRAAEADLMIGDSYFTKKEYLVAAETYQQFLRQYPYHPKADYAYLRSGMAYYKANPKAIDRDQQYLEWSVKNFEILLNNFPNSSYLTPASDLFSQARKRQAEKHYYIARFYYKYGEYLASISRFTEIVNDFPGLGFDEKSFYFLISSLTKVKQYENAQKAYLLFESRFPQSSWLKRAKGHLMDVAKSSSS